MTEKTPSPKTTARRAAAPKATPPQPKKTGLELLREPFTPNQIGKLPKPLFKDSRKAECRECGGYHAMPAIHIDYVGHAALTDRLLDADPAWNWEPVARDQFGQPLIIGGGLWIKLTVCGVTRLGYGDTGGKGGPNGVKEAIGDALRNAAMRFGAALDLWHKGDLHAFKEEQGFAPSEYDYPTRDVNQEPAAPPQAPVSDQTPQTVQPSTPGPDTSQQPPAQPAQNVIYEGNQPVPIDADIPALVHEFEETVAMLPPENKTALNAQWKRENMPYPRAITTKAQIDKAWELYDRIKPAPMQQPTGQDAAANQLDQVRQHQQQTQQQEQARRAFYGTQEPPADNYGPEPDFA